MTATRVAMVFSGVSRQQVAAWHVPKNEPRPQDKAPTYDLVEVVRHREDVAREEGRVDAAAAASSPKAMGALERKREAEAALKEVELAETLGLLVRREDVDRGIFRATSTFLQGLRDIAKKMPMDDATRKMLMKRLEGEIGRFEKALLSPVAEVSDDE
jgi:hypothetical protein